jgi:hypothetical protein
MSGPLGLQFRKLDLHVHTPASRCYHDKAHTPEQVVRAALDKGLSAMAVTDRPARKCIGYHLDVVRHRQEAAARQVPPPVHPHHAQLQPGRRRRFGRLHGAHPPVG